MFSAISGLEYCPFGAKRPLCFCLKTGLDLVLISLRSLRLYGLIMAIITNV